MDESKRKVLMTLQQAIEILEAHNKWRRDGNVPNSLPMQNPTQLGIAIDTVVNHLKEPK